MVRFDDETTTMQVRAPFLERVDYGKKLPFKHTIIIFCAGAFLEAKAAEWGPCSLFHSNTAPMTMTQALHVTMYDFEGTANCNTGALLTAFLRF
jgi:hypothetical protein